MRINNNLMAMNTHRQLGINAENGAKSIEKLSSGYRINRAGDDAAGLAISEKMRGQIRGLNQASRNSQDAISMIQTAEGALNETQAILQRMRELAVQSANDTNVDTDRDALQNEINQLTEEITRIGNTTEFNTQSLLDGTLNDIKFQIGANETQEMSLAIGDMRADALDVVSTQVEIESAGDSVKSVDADDDFVVEGVTVSAVEGGAIGATAKSTDVATTEYAADINVSVSTGVTNTRDLTFDDNGVTLSSGTDVPWDKVNTSGQLTSSGLIISRSGDFVTVDIDVTYSGEQTITVDDAIAANADGDYVYDAHGVSFTISADEFATMSGGDTFKVDFSSYAASGNNKDLTGTIQGNGNLSTTLSGSTDMVFSGSEIVLDATDAQWLEGASNIIISGANLESSGGKITVAITDDNGDVVSQDEYVLSGGQAFISGTGTGTFAYDNHGISFNITNIGSSTDFKLDADIDYIEKSLTTASDNSDDLKFTITNSAGDPKSITVDWGDDGSVISLSGAVNQINIASSGAGAGAVATLDGDKIVLTAGDTGADSEINISQAGLISEFTTGIENGTDASIEFTLKDASDATIDTATIATDTGEVTFEDTDGNELSFTLKEYSDLDGVNVGSEFSVSEIARGESGIDISSQEEAASAITVINDAIESVSDERAKLGAVQNRLEHTIKNLDTSAENLQASESRIRDVDMAKEMMEFTKNNILQQAAQSMLAQANQAPQGVLQLLR